MKKLNENGSIGLSIRMLISQKAGSNLLSKPEITLKSRAEFPDIGTAGTKNLIWMQNGTSINSPVFYLGNVGLKWRLFRMTGIFGYH
ncbi:MAG: hypothetical protein ABJX32_13795 [Tateyamaria sp.]|uniref:hypothetical protein n=1 Tax=Tateyamaria sp. TaxID=1929288 RepID=UPI0032A0A6C7